MTTNSYETTTIPFCPDGALPFTMEITSALTTLSEPVTTTTEGQRTTQEQTQADEV